MCCLSVDREVDREVLGSGALERSLNCLRQSVWAGRWAELGGGRVCVRGVGHRWPRNRCGGASEEAGAPASRVPAETTAYPAWPGRPLVRAPAPCAGPRECRHLRDTAAHKHAHAAGSGPTFNFPVRPQSPRRREDPGCAPRTEEVRVAPEAGARLALPEQPREPPHLEQLRGGGGLTARRTGSPAPPGPFLPEGATVSDRVQALGGCQRG